jgi:hypothetical protein
MNEFSSSQHGRFGVILESLAGVALTFKTPSHYTVGKQAASFVHHFPPSEKIQHSV